jgi:rhomboid family GlyGly-CTERM serine protease
MRNGSPVTLLAGCLCLCFAWPGLHLAPALAWDRSALLHGELWRLWTGHLVHFSVSHALADTLALCAAGMMLEPWLGSRRFAALLLGCAALVSLALLACAPGLGEYRGASGLAMMTATAAGSCAWRRHPRAAPLLGCAALALAAKVAWEALGYGSLSGLPQDVGVAWQAHLLGAACGLAATAAARPARPAPNGPPGRAHTGRSHAP